VTMNDGIPTFANRMPCSVPMAAPAAIAATMATNTDVWLPSGISSSAVMTPPMPLTKPIDRSISPSSSTNTTPMPMIAYGAICTTRFTKFPAVRKLSLRAWK